jgi:hypothetical protein
MIDSDRCEYQPEPTSAGFWMRLLVPPSYHTKQRSKRHMHNAAQDRKCTSSLPGVTSSYIYPIRDCSYLPYFQELHTQHGVLGERSFAFWKE